MIVEWTAEGKISHPVLAMVMIFVGSLLTVALIFSVWANQQALDTDSWVSTSDEVLLDPAVQTELSQYISDELFSNIDIQGDVRSELPASLRDLPDTSAEGLQREAPVEVQKALNTPRFERVWSQANRAAHEKLLAVVDGDEVDPSTDDGQVRLNLNPVITGMSTELGFDEDITAQIPPEVARLTVLEADRVSTAQDVTGVVRLLPLPLALLVILSFGLAILAAGPRRRLVIGWVGGGLVVAGVLALICRGLIGPPLVDWLATDESVRPAVDSAWTIGTSRIVTYSIVSMALGAIMVLVVCAAAVWAPRRHEPDRYQYDPGV